MNHKTFVRSDLAQKIKTLDALSTDEKSALIELLNTKKYGLVWENKPETVEEDLRTQLPILHEVTEKRILGKSEQGETEIDPSYRQGDKKENLSSPDLSSRRDLTSALSLQLDFGTSDLRPQTSDLRPQTSDLRPQTSDLRPGR